MSLVRWILAKKANRKPDLLLVTLLADILFIGSLIILFMLSKELYEMRSDIPFVTVDENNIMMFYDADIEVWHPIVDKNMNYVEGKVRRDGKY